MGISNLLIFIQFTPVSKCSKCWEVASWCESRFPCLNEKTLLFDLTRLSWVLFLWFSHYLYLVEKILPNLMHLNMEQRKKGGWENLRGKIACLTNLGSASLLPEEGALPPDAGVPWAPLQANTVVCCIISGHWKMGLSCKTKDKKHIIAHTMIYVSLPCKGSRHENRPSIVLYFFPSSQMQTWEKICSLFFSNLHWLPRWSSPESKLSLNGIKIVKYHHW